MRASPHAGAYRAMPLARLLAMAFGHLIARLHERLAEEGWSDVRRSYGFVLLAARDRPLSARTVVELLGVTKQAASQLLDAMESDGFVSRAPDPDDARAKVVVITKKGRRLLKDVEAIYAELEAEWASHIGAARVDGLRGALADVLGHAFGDAVPPVRPTL